MDLVLASSLERGELWQHRRGCRLDLGTEFLFAWHCIGFFVLFGAGISMFFSVPSPLRIYQGDAEAAIVFEFSMLLAPNFTVPRFMLAHAYAVVKLAPGA